MNDPDRSVRRRRRAVFGLVLASTLSGGCASAGGERLSIYLSAGTRQCEPAAANPMDAALQRLAAAGVQATAARCGHDGRIRAAMCGLSDGRILVVDVPGEKLDQARTLGWRPLAELPDAQLRRCE